MASHANARCNLKVGDMAAYHKGEKLHYGRVEAIDEKHGKVRLIDQESKEQEVNWSKLARDPVHSAEPLTKKVPPTPYTKDPDQRARPDIQNELQEEFDAQKEKFLAESQQGGPKGVRH